MWAGTTGEQIALVIPAFFQSNHVPYLKDVLESKLDEVFGFDDLSIVIEPGELSSGERGTSYEPGTIAIYGIVEPWPDAADFRKTIEDAFQQAGDIEAEQMAKAHALAAHLRAGIELDV